jgi:ATP-dependent Clp protease adapter protein ClpS
VLGNCRTAIYNLNNGKAASLAHFFHYQAHRARVTPMSHPHGDRPEIPHLPEAAMDQAQGGTKRFHRELPRFRVVLHQDDNDLMFVIHSVMELTRFPRAEATHKMWETVHGGRSILLVTYFERAELYVEQFTSRGLKVTAEPV